MIERGGGESEGPYHPRNIQVGPKVRLVGGVLRSRE